MIEAVRTRNVPSIVDPDTPLWLTETVDHPRAQWVQKMAPGLLTDRLPVTVDQFEDSSAVELFNRAVMSGQAKASALSAGYFPVDALSSAWRAVNRALIKEALKTAAGRELCGWLEVDEAVLTPEAMRELAADYDGVAYLVLRIRGLKTYTSSRAEADVVLDAIEALAQTGHRVIFDCSGMYGAAALPVGAYAFSGGGDHGRSVPKVSLHKGRPQTKAMEYERPFASSLPWAAAVELADAGRLDHCDLSHCDALDTTLPKRTRGRRLRTHFIHTAEATATITMFHPETYVEQLKNSDDEALQAWGEALIARLGSDEASNQSAS